MKFYSNSDGFYANLKNKNALGLSSFVKQVEKGNVNLYEIKKDYYNHRTGMHGTRKKYYVNKDYGELCKVNTRNLKKVLSDNRESMKQLRKVSTFNRIVIGVAVAGLTNTIIGAGPYVKNFAKTDPPPVPDKNKIMLISGVSMLLVANFSHLVQPNKYKAIDIYNSNK